MYVDPEVSIYNYLNVCLLLSWASNSHISKYQHAITAVFRQGTNLKLEAIEEKVPFRSEHGANQIKIARTGLTDLKFKPYHYHVTNII